MTETAQGHAELVERITAYELQVLLGTSISGCVMSPDRTFDLPSAWQRLYKFGLIDRADGIAVATEKGLALINRALSTPIAAHGAGAVTEALTDKDRIDYWKGAYERMAARNHRLNSALKQIRDQHIPDQPAAYGGTEYDWVVRQYANLRSIATDMVEG